MKRESTADPCQSDEIGDQQQRNAFLEWARQWSDGNARCPICRRDDFYLLDVRAEGQLRYETLRCKACDACWKVEFREAAVVVLGGDDGARDNWIELKSLD